MFLDLDVEHHDDEQEQHHDGADVDEHEHDRQELSLEEQPDGGTCDEAQHQEKHRVHRVLGDDHRERGSDQHRCKNIKEDFDQHAPPFPIAPASAVRRIGRLVGRNHRLVAVANGLSLFMMFSPRFSMW